MKAGSLVTPEQTLLCNPCLRLKLAAAILVLSAVPALAAELPSDLAKAVKDYYQAQFHNDVPALKRLVSDDYVLVNSDATGENKQKVLADHSLPGFKIDPYVVEQPVDKVWGNAAVIAGLVHLSWTRDGKHQTRPGACSLYLGEARRPLADHVHTSHARPAIGHHSFTLAITTAEIRDVENKSNHDGQHDG
jgi:hypothetical protein